MMFKYLWKFSTCIFYTFVGDILLIVGCDTWVYYELWFK